MRKKPPNNSKSATARVATPQKPTKETKPKTSTAKAEKAGPKAVKAAKPVKTERTDVFISYSHADKEWLTQLQTHLKPLTRDYKINIWEDTKLRGGDRWREEIEKALAKSKVAILLVSAHFMASDFIDSNELPPLLKAAEKEGVLILPVIVGQSGAFTISNLSQFQAMNGPSQPLNLMNPGQVDQVFTQLFTRVYEAFVKPSSRSKPLAKQAAGATASPVTEQPPTLKTSAKRSGPSGKKVTPVRQNKTLLVKKSGEWEVITVLQSSLKRDLMLELKPSTPHQRAFLTSLRQNGQLSGVVLGQQTHLCSDLEIEQKNQGTQETWHLMISLQSLNRRAQITFGSITPDVQADLQAQLLLLNERIPTEPMYYRSSGLTVPFEASPFPNLFHQTSPADFKQAAPLIACWCLQVNSIVEHIIRLTLTLRKNTLSVRFEGQRGSQYPNDKPAVIKVEGTCDLARPTSDELLLLGPISRF